MDADKIHVQQKSASTDLIKTFPTYFFTFFCNIKQNIQQTYFNTIQQNI